MPKLYACVISPDFSRDKAALIVVAGEFAHAIETLEDGVLFDVSGLTQLIGDEQTILQKIVQELKKRNITGKVAVATNAETAILLARQQNDAGAPYQMGNFVDLPLTNLDIEQDMLCVFNDLGFHRVRDLLAVPEDQLISRYGRKFERIARTIRQQGDRLLVPNVTKTCVSWSHELDFAVEDFEQLLFIMGRGLDNVFADISQAGLSTEHIDVTLGMSKKETKTYEIKTSFPNLEKPFWLKLVNLRIALDPPESEIVSVCITAHFTRPRSEQRGLYAVSRPEPESLLLTTSKLKKLVGEENVGVPVLLNQRLARPFALDGARMPSSAGDDTSPRTGVDKCSIPGATSSVSETRCLRSGIIAFNYFRPAIRASVVVENDQLVSIKTRYFSGRVIEYGGVWRASSRWWDHPWQTQEWDIEVENHGIYRLAKTRTEWLLIGEYD